VITSMIFTVKLILLGLLDDCVGDVACMGEKKQRPISGCSTRRLIYHVQSPGMEPIDCPETSGTSCQPTFLNIAEDQTSFTLRCIFELTYCAAVSGNKKRGWGGSW
jgi:hypothetical protein